MSKSVADKRAAFRALHEKGCFVIPNPWDIGSARMLQHLGFQALASTSSGHAWSIGQTDYGVTRADVLKHLGEISNAVDIPVNADFEAGFADDAKGVAESVTLAIAAGVSGLSIEDRDLKNNRLYDKAQSLERLGAAREAIGRSGHDVMLVARTESVLDDASTVATAIDKLVAFAAAGADCLYAPGVWKKEDIAATVRAVAPKPVNVLVMNAKEMTVAELADLGVRRISIGGSLAATGWLATVKAAEAMLAGSFAGMERISGKRLNDMFEPFNRKA